MTKRDIPKLADGPTFIPELWRPLLEQALKVDPTTASYYSHSSKPFKWVVLGWWYHATGWWPLMWKKNCEDCE